MYAATPEMSAFSFAHSYWSCAAAGVGSASAISPGLWAVSDDSALNKSHAGPDYFIQ